jgi:hypothetical protein
MHMLCCSVPKVEAPQQRGTENGSTAPWHWMELSGQLHDADDLFLGELLMVSAGYGLSEAQS